MSMYNIIKMFQNPLIRISILYLEIIFFIIRDYKKISGFGKHVGNIFMLLYLIITISCVKSAFWPTALFLSSLVFYIINNMYPGLILNFAAVYIFQLLFIIVSVENYKKGIMLMASCGVLYISVKFSINFFNSYSGGIQKSGYYKKSM